MSLIDNTHYTLQKQKQLWYSTQNNQARAEADRRLLASAPRFRSLQKIIDIHQYHIILYYYIIIGIIRIIYTIIHITNSSWFEFTPRRFKPMEQVDLETLQLIGCLAPSSWQDESPAQTSASARAPAFPADPIKPPRHIRRAASFCCCPASGRVKGNSYFLDKLNITDASDFDLDIIWREIAARSPVSAWDYIPGRYSLSFLFLT